MLRHGSAEGTLASFVVERSSYELMALFGIFTEFDPSSIAQLRSCALTPASIWLDTLPTSMVMQLSRNIGLAY